jgi:hypothetical protein
MKQKRIPKNLLSLLKFKNYFIYKNLLNKKQLKEVRSYIEKADKEGVLKATTKFNMHMAEGNTFDIENPIQRNPEFLLSLVPQDLKSFFEKEQFKLIALQVRRSKGSQENKKPYIDWHIDELGSPKFRKKIKINSEPFGLYMIKVLVYINGADSKDKGPTRIVPYSAWYPHYNKLFKYLGIYIHSRLYNKYAYVKPGDALVFNTSALHSAGMNSNLTHNRDILFFTFVRKHIPRIKNYSIEWEKHPKHKKLKKLFPFVP